MMVRQVDSCSLESLALAGFSAERMHRLCRVYLPIVFTMTLSVGMHFLCFLCLYFYCTCA